MVAELLRSGSPFDSVLALVRSEKSLGKLRYILDREGLSIDRVETMEVDMFCVGDLVSAFSGADVVFHTAAVVDLSGADIVRENVMLTEIVVEAALQCEKSPRLIFTSSIAALSDSFDRIEDASSYSCSKFLSENRVWMGARLGLDVGVVLPSVVLGVGAPGSGGLQNVVKMLCGGIPFYVSGGTGFVDVWDVVRAMICVATNSDLRRGQRLVLCGANVLFKDFISQIARINGRRAPFFRVRRGLFYVVAFVLKIFMRRPPLTSDMSSFMFGVSSYDGGEIERLDSRFRYTSLDDSLRGVVSHLGK